MNTVKVIKEMYFSQLLGQPIRDVQGRKVGLIKDMIVEWNGAAPQVTAIKYTKGGQHLIPADWIVRWGDDGLDLGVPFHKQHTVSLRDEEIYIGKWLLDKQIIDLKGSRLVRVNDISLSWVEVEGHRTVLLGAVDIGIRGLFRRLGIEGLVRKRDNHLVGWQHIKPLENLTSSLQLNMEKNQLEELHPADVADIIEEMDYRNRASFVQGLDAQQAVEALAEMELDTQVEIIEQLDEETASDILEEMPPDEAADILSELPEEKSAELLRRMEADDAEEVRELMQYEEGTAGAIMTTEFIGLPMGLTAEQTIERLRELAPTAETIYYLYIVDEAGKLRGVLSLRELIIARPNMLIEDLMHGKIIKVHLADDHDKVADIIRKYGLLAVPVVDDADVLEGIITVDDVVDFLMPEREEDEWGSLAGFFFTRFRKGRGM